MRRLPDYETQEDKVIVGILTARNTARDQFEEAEADLCSFDWVEDADGDPVPRGEIEAGEPVASLTGRGCYPLVLADSPPRPGRPLHLGAALPFFRERIAQLRNPVLASAADQPPDEVVMNPNVSMHPEAKAMASLLPSAPK